MDFAGHTNVGPVATPAQAQASPDDHSYIINARSFAPPESFGGEFQGDNRGYSTDNALTSRIHSEINIDTDDQLAITDNDVAAHSDPSIHHAAPFYQPVEIPDIEILHLDIEQDGDVSIINMRDPGFIDPFNPINDGALELRETYRDVGDEWSEAANEIAEADGFISTAGEVLEGGAEVLWEGAAGAADVVETTKNSVIDTGADMVGVGVNKVRGWFGN